MQLGEAPSRSAPGHHTPPRGLSHQHWLCRCPGEGTGTQALQAQTGPTGPLWNCWGSAGGTTSRWPRGCCTGSTHREGLKQRPAGAEGASVPFTEVSALSCPSRRPRRAGRSFLWDGAEGALTDPGKKSTPRWGSYSQVAPSRRQRSPRHPHMSTKTMKHQPRPPTSSMVTWMP